MWQAIIMEKYWYVTNKGMSNVLLLKLYMSVILD